VAAVVLGGIAVAAMTGVISTVAGEMNTVFKEVLTAALTGDTSPIQQSISNLESNVSSAVGQIESAVMSFLGKATPEQTGQQIENVDGGAAAVPSSGTPTLEQMIDNFPNIENGVKQQPGSQFNPPTTVPILAVEPLSDWGGVFVQNLGSGAMTFQINVTATPNVPIFLKPSVTTGVLGSRRQTLVLLYYDTLGLNPGTYQNVIGITAPGASDSPWVRTITIQVVNTSSSSDGVPMSTPSTVAPTGFGWDNNAPKNV
jgi:hypothetical protein